MSRGVGGPSFRRGLLSAVVLTVAVSSAAADEVTGYVELGRTRFTNAFSVAGANELRTTQDTALLRASVMLDKVLFPNLKLRLGGLLERTDTAAGQLEGTTDNVNRKVRPFINLRLGTPLFLAEVGYDRNEERIRASSNATAGLVRENYTSTLGWYPTAFPSVRYQYVRTNTYDFDRNVVNLTEDLSQLTSDYRPVEPLRLYYRGSLQDTTDRILNNRIRKTIHSGRVTFDDAWWNRRVTVSSDYNVNFRRTEITTAGQGDVTFQIFPLSGLSVISDTPERVTLDPNPALIDENQVAGAGINLGLPTEGADARPRNLGLDFGSDVEVNTLFVWVDRDLRSEIAEAFSWDVYTSPDNLNWTRHATVPIADFNAYLPRFELHFAAVTARYVKAVTKPLSPSQPFATEYPTILVTELQPFIQKPAAEVEGRSDVTTQVYNLDVRARILDDFPLFYELNYFFTQTGPAPSRYTISNGLSLHRALNDVYAVTARVSREDGRERGGDRLAYLSTASLSAVPIDTLRYDLVFSGKDETIGGKSNEAYSVLLNTIAQLYRGIDVNLGLGRANLTSETGKLTVSDQVNASATLAPHPAFTVGLLYQGRTDTSRGGEAIVEQVDYTRSGEADVSFRPVKTLYLFCAYRIENRPAQPSQKLRNVAASWSPFPDGTLRFNFGYNETFRTEYQTKERIVTPSLRWNITPRWYLDLVYQRLTTDSLVFRTDDEIMSATMRFAF